MISSPCFALAEFHTHTTIIERHMKQCMDWLNLNSGVTKLLDHYNKERYKYSLIYLYKMDYETRKYTRACCYHDGWKW